MFRPNFSGIPYKKIILIVWLVFSILYVGWNEWNRFKTYVMERTYIAGRVDTINQLITEAQKCKVFPVTSGDQQVNLVNVSCGQQQQQPAAPAPAPK